MNLGDPGGAAREYRSARTWGLFVALGVATGFVAFGPWLLALFEGFDKAYAPLLILAAGHVIRNGTGMHDDYLAMTGEVTVSTLLRVGGLGVFVVVGTMLIPAMGSPGAALAVLVAMTAINMASVLWRRMRTGFAAVAMGVGTITAASAAALVAVALGALPQWQTAGVLAVMTVVALGLDPMPRRVLRRVWGRWRRKPRG
jgi:O-antigen/teichoic acid export membrane protein